MRWSRFDPLPLVAAAVAALTGVAYGVMELAQGDTPVVTFLGILVLAAVTACFGADRRSTWRRPSLWLSGFALLFVGVLIPMVLALPLLFAAGCAFFGATRAPRSGFLPGARG
ncbi:hypothetical protein [Nocardioides caldifontis]|uniref:hypothetical protein n=1 Tax=Nocardioides caldifontis TaxID=2588938 RepID=UPI0011E0103C|nr:hypothetical protein [Nocardioides caldifontis]